MKKSVIVNIAVMLVALFVNYYLANILAKKEVELAKSRSSLSVKPYGGFNKFISDVQWMFLINYCGSMKSVDSENSKLIYNKLNSILENDPDFAKAYKLGGLMLMVKAPLEAVEILTRGALNKNLSKNANLPFLAGFALTQYVKDSDNLDVLQSYFGGKKLDRLRLADKMFKMAVERSNQHRYISSYLRNKARIINRRGKWKNNMKVVNMEQAYLYALFDEWNKLNESVEFEYSFIDNPEKRIIEAIIRAKKSAPNDKSMLKTIAMIKNTALKDTHLCPNCFHQYGPGEKFCSDCGNKVEIYGVCESCGSLLDGKYCSSCGKKNNN